MKSKIGAIFSAIIMAVTIGLAGIAAPAQADVEPLASGSSVWFAGTDPGIPQTIDLYNTSNSGHEYQQALHTTRDNVAKICPKNSNYRLFIKNPPTSAKPNTSHIRNPGQCFYTYFAGTYEVWLWAA